jgi:hypothetical protein
MGNVPSAAAQVIVTIIPIVGIFMGCGVVFFYLLWSYKAKRALIEKGQYKRPEFDIDTFSLFAGLLLSGIGVSLVVFFFVKSGFGYGILSGLIPLSAGISLVLFFVLRVVMRKRHG